MGFRVTNSLPFFLSFIFQKTFLINVTGFIVPVASFVLFMILFEGFDCSDIVSQIVNLLVFPIDLNEVCEVLMLKTRTY